MLTMFFNYSLKLDARTVKLEKKNGHERADIEKLKKEIAELKQGEGLNPTNSEKDESPQRSNISKN